MLGDNNSKVNRQGKTRRQKNYKQAVRRVHALNDKSLAAIHHPAVHLANTAKNGLH